MNFFDQGIPLGRWFRIRVILHWSFLLYAAFRVFHNNQLDTNELRWICILFGTVLLHEFGHAISCKAVGGKCEQIILWPLGGIAFCQPPEKAWAYLITTVCGPLVNVILWFGFAALLNYGLDPIGQRMGPNSTFVVALRHLSQDMVEINLLLLLFNLIPAYPMDGGRILQELLWMILGYRASLQIAGMIGAALGAGFVIVGLGLQKIQLPLVHTLFGLPRPIVLGAAPNIMLVLIGAMCALSSFGIYYRSMEISGWRKKN